MRRAASRSPKDRMPRTNEQTPLLGATQTAGAAAQRPISESAFYDHPRDEELEPRYEPPPRPFSVILTTCCALWCITFIVSLDTTIVAMLLGNISSDFRESEKAAWIGSTYLLTACCTAPVYGRLCDIIGGKRALNISLAFFAMGTLGCGLGRNMHEFLTARTLAGLGGGGLNTVGSVIVSHLVPLHSRGVYQGLTNIVYGLGIAVGGPLGGILNDTIGWRGAFYVQIPIILIAFLALFTLLDNSSPFSQNDPRSVWSRVKDIDFVGLGVITFVPLTLLYVLDLVSVKDVPFTDTHVLTGCGVIVFAFVAFYCVERYIARIPLISLDVLALRSGWSSLWANYWGSMAVFAYNFNFPLFFQVVGRLPPSVIGARMIPASCALSLGSLISGLYMRKTGYYYRYTVGCLVVTVVASGQMMLYGMNPPTVTPFVYNVFLAFAQAGYITTTLLALINSVEKHAIGVSTGMSYFFRTNGQVAGVALSGGILQVSLLRALRSRIVGPDAESVIAQIRHEATAIPTLPEAFQQAATESYTLALHNVFVYVCLCNLLALLCGAMIENKRLPMPFDRLDSGHDEERH